MTDQFNPAGSPRRDQFPASSGPRPKSAGIDSSKPQPEPPATKRADEVKVERRRRKSTGPTAGLKLHIPDEAKDPNYEYRYFLDEPGRIHQKTVMDDWDLVSMDDLKGHADPSLQAEGGTRVARFAEKQATGPGVQPRRLFLARKLKELYKVDKRQEQDALKAREDELKRSATPVAGGLSGSTAYIPDRHEGFSGPEQGQNRIDRG